MALPTPEAGLVISYGYLWHYEHQAGREEGRKDRPCVIVLVVEQRNENETVVTVLPVTHRPPDNPADAVEMPSTVKRHLQLDDQRSWVVVNEGNEFLWPGYDLRKVPEADRYDYGFLPPGFFKQVMAAFTACHKAGKAASTPR
jgi:hypothetical protein